MFVFESKFTIIALSLALITPALHAAPLTEPDRQLIESALSSQQGGDAAQQNDDPMSKAATPFRQRLIQSATKKHLDTNPAYAAIFKKSREEALAKAAILDQLNGAPVTEAEITAAYQVMKKGYEGKKEFHVKHIVMASQADADAILSELQRGANFEKLAKAKSKDGGSAALGGDAGWLTDCMLGCNYTKGLEEQAKEVGFNKLPKRVIASPMGFFVAVVQVIRPLKAPTLKEARPALLKQVRQQKFQKVIGAMG